MTTKCAAGRPLKYIDPWGWYHDDDHISDRDANLGHGTPCDHDLEPMDWDWEKAERTVLAEEASALQEPP